MYPLTHTLSFTNRNKLRSGKKIRRHPASAAATPWLIQHFATWCSLNFHRSMNRTTMTVVLRCLWEGIVTQAAKSSLVFTFAGKHKGKKDATYYVTMECLGGQENKCSFLVSLHEDVVVPRLKWLNLTHCYFCSWLKGSVLHDVSKTFLRHRFFTKTSPPSLEFLLFPPMTAGLWSRAEKLRSVMPPPPVQGGEFCDETLHMLYSLLQVL